jgi:hypothetical protein
MIRSTGVRWRSSDAGQVLVIVAIALLGIVAVAALVIDGGFAWGRQRETQNGADAVAVAGTAIIQQALANEPMTDGDVGCAVDEAATDNDVTLESAEYTDYDGDAMGVDVGPCAPGAGGAIPAGAQGVRALASQEFETFVAGVVGVSELTVEADATAVVGIQPGVCPGAEGCGILPVTFPRTIDSCDGTTEREVGDVDWPILNPATDTLDASNLSIVPLCTTNNGSGGSSVGWLNLPGCPNNLAQTITTPCHSAINIPAWLDTSSGNPNDAEDELEDYTGPQPGVAEAADAVVQVPIHDNTCRSKPADSVATCPEGNWSGRGSELHYHIPYWVGFKLDGAFVGGSDPECGQAPGGPLAMAGGGLGCLKGWFVSQTPAPGVITPGSITPGAPVVTGVLLVN